MRLVIHRLAAPIRASVNMTFIWNVILELCFHFATELTRLSCLPDGRRPRPVRSGEPWAGSSGYALSNAGKAESRIAKLAALSAPPPPRALPQRTGDVSTRPTCVLLYQRVENHRVVLSAFRAEPDAFVLVRYGSARVPRMLQGWTHVLTAHEERDAYERAPSPQFDRMGREQITVDRRREQPVIPIRNLGQKLYVQPFQALPSAALALVNIAPCLGQEPLVFALADIGDVPMTSHIEETPALNDSRREEVVVPSVVSDEVLQDGGTARTELASASFPCLTMKPLTSPLPT